MVPADPESKTQNGRDTIDWANAVDATTISDENLPGVTGYKVTRVLGRGGMGVVYQAQQVRASRIVALKMILAGEHARPEDLSRFRTEAQAVS